MRIRETLLLGLAMTVVTVSTAAAQEPPIIIRVYDLAGLPPEHLSEAFERAGRVLRHAGVAADWVICSDHDETVEHRCSTDLSPLDLMVRLKRGVSARGTAVCGVSLRPTAADAGHQILLYTDCIAELSSLFVVSEPTALAFCMVHEIGHLLLPTAAHGVDGPMRASLSQTDWRRAAAGRFGFSNEEAEAMRAGVASRARAVAAAASAGR